MLAPHELKNKPFSKVMRGYNPSEVDDHIELLIEKYTELYRENAELNRKLSVVVTKLDEIKEEEASIKSTLISAHKEGERIISEANAQADLITGALKERCDAVIADFKMRMAAEKQELWSLRTGVLDFKQEIFDLYAAHIKALQAVNVNSLEEIVLPNEDAIVEEILGDVANAVKTNNAAELEEEKQADLNPAPVAAPDEIIEPVPQPSLDVDGDFYVETLKKANDNKA